MLMKLLKYEIPAVGRRLGPMYIAWLAASVLFGLTAGRFDDSGFFILIPGVVYFAVTVAVFVMAIVLIIQRYYNSLFGDEAYFNQALPVTASEHIMNKILTALVWIVLTMLAALLSGLIIVLLMGGENFVLAGEPIQIPELWGNMSGIDSLKSFLMIFEFLVLAVFSMLKSILAIYAAISIGHIARNHVVLASIGAYIGLMVFESSLGNLFISLGFLTSRNTDINLMISSSDFTAFQAVLGVSFLISLILIAVYFFICRFFIEKKLNLQ